MRFYETPIGNVYGHVIHETNTAICYLGNVKFYLDETTEHYDKEKALNYIKAAQEKIKEGTDYGYDKIKKLCLGSEGVMSILIERERQISKEGWTPEHDDEHIEGELLDAAIFYAAYHTRLGDITGLFPWADEWYKPVDKIRDLEKAGALIAAEIDRLKRLKAKK